MKTAEAAHLRVADDITQLVGETPMLRLRRVVPAGAAEVFAKLEYLNPGGSVKDRAAIGMIRRAEEEGKLKPGATLIEATAGNTGIGLALIGVNRGYRVIFCVPERFSEEKVKVMRALGAEVIRTVDVEGMQGAIAHAKRIAASIPGSFMCSQFENQANPDYHYETTAREIFEQMQGRVDDAERLYRSAVGRAPKLAPPRGLLGSLLLARGDVEGALEQFDIALELGDDTEGVIAGRAEARRKLSQP